MRFHRALGFTAAVLSALLLTASLFAQQPVPGATPVQSYQPLYVCDQAATATGAGNTTVTLTLTPPSGQFVYLCHIDITTIANAAVTAAAGPAQLFTTTNLPVNLVWWGDNGTYTTGQSKPVLALPFGVVPLKSAVAGTAFTIVGTAGQSTTTVRINATAFFGK